MLEPINDTAKLPEWKDVKVGDLILIDYEIPHVCAVIGNSDNEKEIDIISLTRTMVRWTAVGCWKQGCSNKLLKIYKPGDTFVIA